VIEEVSLLAWAEKDSYPAPGEEVAGYRVSDNHRGADQRESAAAILGLGVKRKHGAF